MVKGNCFKCAIILDSAVRLYEQFKLKTKRRRAYGIQKWKLYGVLCC